MKTIVKGKRSLEQRAFSRGGRSLSRRFASQIRWVSTAQDLKDMPRSSWKGHIAERIGHLMLVSFIWVMPVLLHAEILVQNPMDSAAGEMIQMELLGMERNLVPAVSLRSLNGYDREIEQMPGQFQIKDQVLLSWKTFFCDQSMLRRRIDVYA